MILAEVTAQQSVALDYFYSTLDDTITEMHSAVGKHGFENTPLNPNKDLRDSYIILAEEVGEVARAMTYDEGDTVKLYAELIQVGAMALAMAAGLEYARDGQ